MTSPAEVELAIGGLTCASCAARVEKKLNRLDGVITVDVDIAGGRVTVTTGGEPDDAAIGAAIDDAGYELTGRA